MEETCVIDIYGKSYYDKILRDNENVGKQEIIKAESKMKIGYIQYDVSHRREENFRVIQHHLEENKADVVVLPELCTCGYLFESREALRKAAEPVPQGPTVNFMTELSKTHQCTIVFGLAELEGDAVYNTATVVHGGQYVGKYRKIHLSDFEKQFFTPGNANGVFEIGDMKLGVQICFDLWFPEVTRQQIKQGASLLCALGNFGGETTYHIAQTRAVESLTPLVLCNRVGEEKLPELDADFLGKSSVIDANGTRVAAAPAHLEAAGFCEIDIGQKKGNVICRNFQEEIQRHNGAIELF